MIAELTAILGLIVDHIDNHPDQVKKLAATARDVVNAFRNSSTTSIEAQRGLAAGFAAAKSNAVQAFVRDQQEREAEAARLTEREQLEHYCADLGRGLKKHVLPPGVGFALLLFNFGDGGNLAYVSNAVRADLVKTLEEFRDVLISTAADPSRPAGQS